MVQENHWSPPSEIHNNTWTGLQIHPFQISKQKGNKLK
jgi:hypothetical protein